MHCSTLKLAIKQLIIHNTKAKLCLPKLSIHIQRNEPDLVIIEPSSSVTKSDKEVGQLKSIAKKSEMTTKEESKKRKFEDIAAKKGKKKQR